MRWDVEKGEQGEEVRFGAMRRPSDSSRTVTLALAKILRCHDDAGIASPRACVPIDLDFMSWHVQTATANTCHEDFRRTGRSSTGQRGL